MKVQAFEAYVLTFLKKAIASHVTFETVESIYVISTFLQ